MKVSKKMSSLVLGITAIICSRAMFAFFDDPEGPNLLIVIVAALVIYGAAAAISAFFPRTKEADLKGLMLRILIQVLITAGLYLCLIFI